VLDLLVLLTKLHFFTLRLTFQCSFAKLFLYFTGKCNYSNGIGMMKNTFASSKWLPALVLGAALSVPVVSFADIAVVVSPDSQLQNIAGKDLKNIYLGKTSKIAGVKYIPISLPNYDPAAIEFIDKLLGKSMKQYVSYWAQRVFTGKSAPPPELENSVILKTWLADNPEGIGYVDAKDVDDKVRVILVSK